MKSKEIVSELEKSVSSFEKKIDDSKKHNLKYGVISLFIKLGIGLDYLIPFITSTVIIWNIFNLIDKNPLSTNSKKIYAKSYSMITSNGYEKELISYDNDYETFDKDIEYSTAWVLNEYNLYEREIIVYRYNDKNINLYDLFNMTNEELGEIYTLCNIRKVQKSKLTDEDKIYNEDTIIFNSVRKSNQFKETEKDVTERLFELMLLIIHAFGLGYIGERLRYIFIKDTIADKLKRVQKKYKPIGKNDFECAKKILEIRENNLSLIKESGWQKKHE